VATDFIEAVNGTRHCGLLTRLSTPKSYVVQSEGAYGAGFWGEQPKQPTLHIIIIATRNYYAVDNTSV